MVLNSLFPVFALVVIGSLLKHYRLTNDIFLKTSDRLVYFIFFPAMLFWKIGGASSSEGIDWDFCNAALCAVFTLYILSSLYIKFFNVSEYDAGTFSQSCYRFNTYIGMAVIINALGEDGIRHFGILIGFAIPFINVLAVSTLIWFSGKQFSLWERARVTGKALISNPLILACISGMIYSRMVSTFPAFLDNTFRLTSYATLPLALLSIGGALTFENLKSCLKLSLAGSVFKLLIFPVTGYAFLKGFHVTGLPFKIGMIFFTLPTSPAIYVLSSQLNSSTELASASIVLSTILSFLSLSVALFICQL
jgi:predicted permease